MNKDPLYFKVDFEKTDRAIFLPQIYMVNVLTRVFRKCGVQFEYTQGFNPRPRIKFIYPLSVGMEGSNEMFFFSSWNHPPPVEVLNEQLPRGLELKRISAFGNRKYSEKDISGGIFEFKLKKAYNTESPSNCEAYELLSSSGRTFRVKFTYQKKCKIWDMIRNFSGGERFENLDYLKREQLW